MAKTDDEREPRFFGDCLILGADAARRAKAREVLVAALGGAEKVLADDIRIDDRDLSEWVRVSKEEYADRLEAIEATGLIMIDVTGGSPDAIYLTAIAHALRPALTIPFFAGEKPDLAAFGVGGDQVFVDLAAQGAQGQVKDRLKGFLNAAMRPYDSPLRATKSLTVSVASKRASLNKGDGELEHGEFKNALVYSSKNSNIKTNIVIALGDMAGHDAFDIWVNSENINMSMARIEDRSVSASIRYLGSGATDDDLGRVSRDFIRKELARAMGARSKLTIGDVVLTQTEPTTTLHRKNKVLVVAHVAAVESAGPGKGFKSVGQERLCVRNVLDETAVWTRRVLSKSCRRILFPLLGAGDGGAPVEVVAETMVEAIESWLLEEQGRKSTKPAYDAIGIIVRAKRPERAVRAALAARGWTHAQTKQTKPDESDAS